MEDEKIQPRTAHVFFSFCLLVYYLLSQPRMRAYDLKRHQSYRSLDHTPKLKIRENIQEDLTSLRNEELVVPITDNSWILR